MPDFETGARLPHDPRRYQIEAFYDDDSDDDVPDLHISMWNEQSRLPGPRGGFADMEIALRMDLDWSYDDCREFWNRLKAAAEKALARLDYVEQAAK